MTEVFEPDVDFEERSNDLDLAALGSAISRKRNWILIPTALGFLAASLFVAVVKPRYTAEAGVLLENQESFLTGPQLTEAQVQQTSGTTDEALVGSQEQLITSPDLGRRAIQDLHLVGNPEFDPYAHGLGIAARLLVISGLMRDPMRISAEDRVLGTFEQRLSVYSPAQTRVITIQFWSADPNLAARAANEIASLYLQMQSNAKRELAKKAAASLSTQIAELKDKVARAADDVERYRASAGLLAGTNNMTITGQQLADLNSELSHARTQQADSQAKASLIRDMLREGHLSEVPDVANNDLIRRIAEQLVTARAQLALESGALLPGHPRIKELKAEIADLEVQLRTAAETIARALENDSSIAAARVANLEATIGQQKKQVVVSNTDAVRLHELERAAQALRAQLDASMTKYQEALAVEYSASTPPDARIISRAAAPDEPSFPKKVPTLAFGTFAAFVLSLGVVVGSDLLSGGPPETIGGRKPGNFAEDITRIKRFGHSRRDDPAIEAGFAEVLREEIAAERGQKEKIVARAATEQGVHILATRASESEAATAALIGFARSLAREGRPIIIDLDRGAGQVAALMAKPEKPTIGLTDLLEGSVSFADVIHRDQASRLHFIAVGTVQDFDPDDLDVILDALMQTYDFVVLAAPPLSASDLPKALAPFADFVVLAMPGKNDAETEAARATLKAAGAAEVLVIDNAETADAIA